VSCSPDTTAEGPELVVVRNTKHVITMRAYRGRLPLRFDASDLGLIFVISTERGVDAEIALTINPVIIADPDDGTFVVTFEPHFFSDLPEEVYTYAMFTVTSFEFGEDVLQALTLPATLRIVESIGPSQVRLPELLV